MASHAIITSDHIDIYAVDGAVPDFLSQHGIPGIKIIAGEIHVPLPVTVYTPSHGKIRNLLTLSICSISP
jgi:hypothetical protein